MKNILVLAGGGGSDHAVFAAAFGIAQPLDAHLEFFHVQVDRGGGNMATACRVREGTGDVENDAAPGDRVRHAHRRCER